MSPEQRVLFERLHFHRDLAPTPATVAANSAPMATEEGRWYNKGADVPTSTEILVLAAVTFIHFEANRSSTKDRSAKSLDNWLNEIETDHAEMERLGARWRSASARRRR